MDFKQILQTYFIIYSMKGCYSTISLDFCSGKSIKDFFDNSSRDRALRLDGSYTAIKQWAGTSERGTCTCVVTSNSPVPDKLHVDLEFYRKSIDGKVCDKNVEVRHGSGELEHLFSCYSNDIEIQRDDLDEGIQFKLNWFGNSGTSDFLNLYIAPEPGTVLGVTCNSPAFSTTTPRVNATYSSTVKVSTSTKAFVTGESTDSMVVVGVIVGLGLFFLLFISCMLFYIARRKRRTEGMEEKHSTSDQTSPQQHNKISRTLTHFYGRMRVNRPLPSIPSSIRNIHPFKSRRQNRSGVYDSIKSNNNNAKQVLDKQTSQSSDCSYLEPITITTISETVNRKPKAENVDKETDELSHQATKVKEKLTLQAKKSSSGSANDLYLHPKYEVELYNTQNINMNEPITKDKNSSKQTYVNHRFLDALCKNSFDQDTTDAFEDDTEVKMCCSGYMRMDSSACIETDQVNVDNENIDNTNSNKTALTETDSNGYLSMSSMNKNKNKPVLEQNDSTFPQLINFTSHFEADLNDTMNKQREGQEKDIVKTKRYVKETK